MRWFPDSKDERIALVLLPFKAIISAAYLAIAPAFPRGSFMRFLAEPLMNACWWSLPALLAGGIIQLLVCQREKVAGTLGFLLAGLLLVAFLFR
jgi:hypothetical protein